MPSVLSTLRFLAGASRVGLGELKDLVSNPPDGGQGDGPGGYDDGWFQAQRVHPLEDRRVLAVSVVPNVTAVSSPEGSAVLISGQLQGGTAGNSYTINFDWGDGSADGSVNVVADAGGKADFSLAHTYGDDGDFTQAASNPLVVSVGAATASVDVTVTNVAPTIALTGNATVNEGATYTLNLGAVTDPGADTVTAYRIDWGDGTAATVVTGHPAGQTATHVYADDGAYSISVDLTDEDGVHAGAGALDVTVNNVAPTIALTGNATVNEGATYTLNLGSVTDPGADTVTSYRVNWGDGSTTGFTSGNPSGQTATHAYADNGSYTITVDLRDGDGTYLAAGTKALTVNDVPPTIALTGNASVNEGATYTLDVGAITDPGTDMVTQFRINWGDGNSTGFLAGSPTGESFTHTYVNNGSYSITVDLINEDGTHTAAGTKAVTVNNLAPTVGTVSIAGFIGTIITIPNGDTITLEVTFSDPGLNDFADGQTLTGVIDWRDGSALSSVTISAVSGSPGTYTFTASHTYNVAPGTLPKTYAIRVSLNDGTATSATDVATVTVVNNTPPAVTLDQAGPLVILEGGSVTVSGGYVDDSRGAHTAVINWGDGQPNTVLNLSGRTDTFTANHTYSDNGSYTVTVTVTDSSTLSGSDTVVVNVANVAPTIPINGNASVNEGANYSITLGNVVDPGTDTVTQYRINWGDGTSTGFVAANPNGVTASHVYADNGPYTITVDVIDEDGTFTAAGSKAITVNNVAPTIALTGNATVSEGATYTLNLGAVVDPGTDTISAYVINWGDGTNSGPIAGNPAGQSTTHVYANNGSYTISVTLTDEDGSFPNAGTLTVTVNDVAPVIDAASVQLPPINEGQPGQLTFQFFDPGVNDTYTVLVDWGDGRGFVDVTAGAVLAPNGLGGRTVTVNSPANYVQDGTYAVQIRLVDAANAAAFSTAGGSIQVNDVPPAINEPTILLPDINEGQQAQLTVHFFDPGLLDAHTIVIDWGNVAGPIDMTTSGTFVTDGAGNWTFTATSPTVYVQDGQYAVTIQVTDTVIPAATDMAAVTLRVNDVAPIIEPGSVVLSPISEGQNAQLTFVAFDPGVADQLVVRVDWGDGKGPVDVTAVGRIVGPGRQEYVVTGPVMLQDGAYPVQISVLDTLPGALPSVPLIPTLTVTNVAPLITGITVLPNAINEGQAVTLQVTFTDPGLLDFDPATPVDVSVTWGDGTALVGSVTLRPNGAGSYTFDITRVYEDDAPTAGSTDINTITLTFQDDHDPVVNTFPPPQVTVHNLPPVVTSSLSPVLVSSIGAVTVNIEFTDPGIRDNLTLSRFDMGGPGIVLSAPRITSMGNGVFMLTAEVQYTDDPPSVAPGDPNPVPHFTVQFVLQDDDGGVVVGTIDANVPSGIARLQPESPAPSPSLGVPQSIAQTIPAAAATAVVATVESDAPSSAQSSIEDSTVQIVLREVLPSGRESLLGTFDEDELDDVLSKLRGLPDRHYRVYMIMPDGSERPIVDVVVRQGQLSDPAADVDQLENLERRRDTSTDTQAPQDLQQAGDPESDKGVEQPEASSSINANGTIVGGSAAPPDLQHGLTSPVDTSIQRDGESQLIAPAPGTPVNQPVGAGPRLPE